jgi:cytochrome c553
MAGTVYQLFRDNAPAAGVLVLLEDITGQAKTATTNAAGNFYLEPSEWNPTYPVTVKVQLGTVTKQMSTDIARAASCAECHRDPPNQTSPGHVYVAVNATELAKAQGGQ